MGQELRPHTFFKEGEQQASRYVLDTSNCCLEKNELAGPNTTTDL